MIFIISSAPSPKSKLITPPLLSMLPNNFSNGFSVGVTGFALLRHILLRVIISSRHSLPVSSDPPTSNSILEAYIKGVLEFCSLKAGTTPWP